MTDAYEAGFKAGGIAEQEKMRRELTGNGFEGITSGRKIAKKLRQQYVRQLNGLASDRVNRLYKDFEEHIRPKPRWMPGPVWKVIQRIVLINYI